MPYVNIRISEDAKFDQTELTSEICNKVSEITGKAKQYIMVSVERAFFMFQDSAKPAAFIDIKGIGGINPDTNKKLSEVVCSTMNNNAGVLPERVYINFTDIAAANWGWNSSTFGG